MNERLSYLMQQLAETKRRDAALEVYRQEVQAAQHDARREGYDDMLRDMKDAPAPEAEHPTQPQYIAEPEITAQGAKASAYRRMLAGLF